nr:dynamin-like protein 6 [Tanacetum cinerariifolium]
TGYMMRMKWTMFLQLMGLNSLVSIIITLMERRRREEEIKTRSSNKVVDATQVDRSPARSTSKSLKDGKQDKDTKEGSALKTVRPEGKITEETEGPYYTDLPTPEEINQFLQFQRVESNRTIKSKTVTLSPNQVLNKEIRQDLKRWEELIRENVFGLGGNMDHLHACLAHILYCIIAEQQYNLAHFFVKRIESAKDTPKARLSYGIFLTRLFRHIMEHYPYLDNGIYNVIDRVMFPLALRQTRKPHSDRGIQKARHSVSSSSTHHFRSSSHQGNDDDDEGTT